MIELKTMCRIFLCTITIIIVFLWFLGILYFHLIGSSYYCARRLCKYAYDINARNQGPAIEILHPELLDVVDDYFESPLPNYDDDEDDDDEEFALKEDNDVDHS